MNITCVTTHTLRCAQVCAILLCSVNAGSSHATGRICKQLPQQYGPLAAALAVLRGRALSVHTIRQFVQTDSAVARWNFKQHVYAAIDPCIFERWLKPQLDTPSLGAWLKPRPEPTG